MTRFKEGRRIAAAIEKKNRAELEWAASYCKMRLKICPTKYQQKHWQQMERKIQKTLSGLSDG